jgi:hypothetical protein
MIHPDTELKFISETMGHGVFATRLIPKGTITWVRDDFDQSFTAEQIQRMQPKYREILEKYSYVDGKGLSVLCWDHARFFNHSCDANCLSAGYDFELAVRDIACGEELTDDYGTLNLREEFRCACQARDCRELIRPDDMERLVAGWDAVVQKAFPLITAVAQPLWAFLREREEVEAVLNRTKNLVSIRANYANGRLASAPANAIVERAVQSPVRV